MQKERHTVLGSEYLYFFAIAVGGLVWAVFVFFAGAGRALTSADASAFLFGCLLDILSVGFPDVRRIESRKEDFVIVEY